MELAPCAYKSSVAAIAPFGAIDLVASALPSAFAALRIVLLALDELRSHTFEAANRDGVLPLAIARYLTLLTNLNSPNETKKNAARASLTQIPGDDAKAVSELIDRLADIEPLDAPTGDSEADRQLRSLCRNIICLTLVQSVTNGP